ncbi:Fic family protein [Acetoanaerobium sticklandii]
MAEILEIIGDKEYFTKELMELLELKHKSIFLTMFIHFAAQQ